uniref:Uncharacterized protein n=1 Tax=Chryseobacterium endophyticum TaxID=1854762 RepID=A0AAU6WMI5_9FLAO
MKGNMYGGGNPLIANIQGYIYYDTIIARSGYSTLYYWNYIIALNLNGKLCFWFPSLSYWQGFDVKVTIGNGGLEQGKTGLFLYPTIRIREELKEWRSLLSIYLPKNS